MCSLVAHDKLQPDYKYFEIIIEDRSIPDNSATKALEELGATINFIDIWIQLFLGDYNPRCDTYINTMREMLNQIHQTMKKAITPNKKSRNS